MLDLNLDALDAKVLAERDAALAVLRKVADALDQLPQIATRLIEVP